MRNLTAALYQTFERGRQRGHRDAIDAARRLFPASDVDALASELISLETRPPVSDLAVSAPEASDSHERGTTTGGLASGALRSTASHGTSSG